MFKIYTSALLILLSSWQPSDLLIVKSKGLYAEGITWSESQKKFYLNSINQKKIIAFDGYSHADFIPTEYNGYLSGIGIEADDTRGLIWGICSGEKGKSKLMGFDSKQGDLKYRFELIDDKKHFFNDLAIDKSGKIYVTDTDQNSIYIVNPEENQMDLFYEGTEIEFPNGICVHANDSILYVASFTKGIRALSTKSGQLLNQEDNSVLTKGIDGLKYYQNTLIAIQNGFQNPENHRINRYYLSNDDSNIVNYHILTINHPSFETPTTFTIKNDTIFAIANSQVNNLTVEDNQIIDSSLTDFTKILVLPIDP